MSNTDRVILRELGFFGHHGVLPVEAQNGQHFTATVELEFSLSTAGQSDHLDDTVDYRAVQAVVRGVIEGSRKYLIETLAERVAAEILHHFQRVDAVCVEISKPRPPVDFQFAGVSVRIRRERSPHPL
ncbi:MAG: dihydroneopterin aldolase [Opitutaceae bacterium]|nr:dihydroneopterin aldolase [Opitutaceae bacterium]